MVCEFEGVLYFILILGNSCDIGQIKPELRLLSHELNATFFAVEYPGYGVTSHENEPITSSGIDFRVRAAFTFLCSLGVDSKNIIFFGRSIGTGMFRWCNWQLNF